MKKVLPTMTIYGYLKHPSNMIVKLFYYFITNNKSQSLLYYENIRSLRHLLFLYNNKLDELRENVERELLILYKQYWDDVKINVDIETLQNETREKEINILKIDIVVRDEEDEYSLSKSLEFSKNKLHINDIYEYFEKGETYGETQYKY